MNDPPGFLPPKGFTTQMNALSYVEGGHSFASKHLGRTFFRVGPLCKGCHEKGVFRHCKNFKLRGANLESYYSIRVFGHGLSGGSFFFGFFVFRHFLMVEATSFRPHISTTVHSDDQL